MELEPLSAKHGRMPWPKGKPRGPLSAEHLAATRRKPRPPTVLLPEVAECSAWLRKRRRADFGRDAGLRYVPDASLTALATRLTLNEAVGDPRATQVRGDLVRMIFNRRRLDWTRGWRVERITAAMPESWEARRVVAENFTIAEKLLGPIGKQAFSAVRFVELSVQLDTSAAFENYVNACLQQETRRSKTVSAIISEEAFQYWSNSKDNDLLARGRAYLTTEQHEEYRDLIRTSVQTVR